MGQKKLIKWTGIFGLCGGILLLFEIALWIIPGEAGLEGAAVLSNLFL